MEARRADAQQRGPQFPGAQAPDTQTGAPVPSARDRRTQPDVPLTAAQLQTYEGLSPMEKMTKYREAQAAQKAATS